MKKEELIEELKKEIEVTKKVSNCEEHVKLYEKGKRVGLEFGWMIAEKLDEPELPVIPQFIADVLKEYKDNKYKTLYGLFFDVEREMITGEFGDWFVTDGNYEVFCRAWLDGYTIEKEEMYRINFGRNKYAMRFSDEAIDSMLTDKELAAKFTEQEIKAIDERYWAFAEPVEDSK